MKAILRLLKSRANWTIVAMFVIGGVGAVTQFIPTGFMPLVEGALALLTVYFVRNPSQEYGTKSE